MNKQELVKWTAEQIEAWVISNYPIGDEVFSDLAKNILSHPDLALIIDTTVWAHIKGFREVIPLAEALREKNEKQKG